ncbi:hypothetical protein BC829DRAFT_443170 [Chytridium lagenaria]|nr:hypothetical protein BC829DRAFT_443170 [Chytridium lagenaria]
MRLAIGCHSEIILGSDDYNINVYDRDLVVLHPITSDIIKQHNIYHRANAHTKETKENVLVYVTPWNNHGYDVAKMFRGKFTHISPVWYTIKPVSAVAYELTGSHDVDKGWIEDVTQPTDELTPKIVPRFQLSEIARDHIVDNQNFDGFVLEFHLSGYTPTLIETLSIRAKAAQLQFFLVIFPQRPDQQQTVFDRSHFDLYKDLVDGFSLMTYDFSNSQNPGPNAPLSWIEENILTLCPDFEDRPKLLGVSTCTATISRSPTAVHAPKLEYVESASEHKFTYIEKGEKHEVWYPSLKSLDERLLAIEELGTGISVWEIGQGLDFFFSMMPIPQVKPKYMPISTETLALILEADSNLPKELRHVKKPGSSNVDKWQLWNLVFRFPHRHGVDGELQFPPLPDLAKECELDKADSLTSDKKIVLDPKQVVAFFDPGVTDPLNGFLRVPFNAIPERTKEKGSKGAIKRRKRKKRKRVKESEAILVDEAESLHREWHNEAGHGVHRPVSEEVKTVRENIPSKTSSVDDLCSSWNTHHTFMRYYIVTNIGSEINDFARYKDVVIVVGSGASFFSNPNVSKNIRGKQKGPMKKLLRAMVRKKGWVKKVLMQKEPYTSSVCPCELKLGNLEKVRGQGGPQGSPIHSVLSCKSCFTLWNRDVLGALNIMRCCIMVAMGHDYPLHKSLPMHRKDDEPLITTRRPHILSHFHNLSPISTAKPPHGPSTDTLSTFTDFALHSGALLKLSPDGSWRRLYLLLTPTHLLTFSSKHPQNPSLKPSTSPQPPPSMTFNRSQVKTKPPTSLPSQVTFPLPSLHALLSLQQSGNSVARQEHISQLGIPPFQTLYDDTPLPHQSIPSTLVPWSSPGPHLLNSRSPPSHASTPLRRILSTMPPPLQIPTTITTPFPSPVSPVSYPRVQRGPMSAPLMSSLPPPSAPPPTAPLPPVPGAYRASMMTVEEAGVERRGTIGHLRSLSVAGQGIPYRVPVDRMMHT